MFNKMFRNDKSLHYSILKKKKNIEIKNFKVWKYVL